jgi:phosphohistidine phosphatase
MKKLIFVRHGKAEEPAEGISDLERSLTIKGKIMSGQVARDLRALEKSPGLIITSPAFRAIETALIFADEFGISAEEIKIVSSIYYKMNLPSLKKMLSAAGKKSDTITLFGHNPSFTTLADSLCREGCDFIPKCGVVGISFDIDAWLEIKPKSGQLEFNLRPAS